MTPDRYKYFRIEAAELLEQLSRGLLGMEQVAPSAQVIAALLRQAHTLKGAARVVRQIEIADAAHAMEDELARYQTQGQKPNVQALLGLLDKCTNSLSRLTPSEGAVKRNHNAIVNEQEHTPELTRVELKDVDAVREGVAESLAELAQLRANGQLLSACRELVELVERQVGAKNLANVRQYEQLLRSTHVTVGEALQSMQAFERRYNATLDLMERELGQAHDCVNQLRLVRADTIFSGLERAVRDAAAELGKEVRFEGHGSDVKMDGHILDTLFRALVQIVRNAVAHGIESPELRTRIGKPKVGFVRVDVKRSGNQIRFSCQDDGSGIDVKRLYQLAGARDVSNEPPEDVALLQLLLNAGVTTATQVSTVAGRGVGMSIVREALEGVGGQAHLTNVPGRGLALELAVPATLSALAGLLVDAGDEVFVLPLADVRETVHLRPDLLVDAGNGGHHLRLGSEVVPYAPLYALLGRDAPEVALRAAVVVGSGAQRLALGVALLLGSKTQVVHRLPDEVGALQAVSGAVLDAFGNPQLVLDVGHLIASRQQTGGQTRPALERRPILVIDDSLTTRMLQQSILESVGYIVELATSAEQAWEMAISTSYSLFLVDVEMPGMDGFSFVERTRADPRFAQIPAILVSSRSSKADLARGEAVGAKAYMVKDRFDQRELLRWIRNILGY